MELQYVNNLPSFDDLPLIAAEQIMDYLPMYDYLLASQTCRRWHNVSRLQKLRKRIKLSFKQSYSSKYSGVLPLGLFVDSSRIFENIKLNSIVSDDLNFFQRCGMNIKQLGIVGNRVDYNLLLEILNCLPVLEQLELSFFFQVKDVEKHELFKFDELHQIPVGLKNLKSLRLVNNNHVTVEILSRIKQIIPNLKEFTMKETSTFGLNTLANVECFNFLKKYQRSLKTLNISRSFCENLFNDSLIKIEELNLEELHIETNKIQPALKFILTQKNLTTLDMNIDLSSTELTLICDTLTKLKSLRFKGKDIPSQSIKNLKNLKTLYLTSNFIKSEYICSSRNEILQVLHLKKVEIDPPFLTLLVNLPNLRDFKFTYERMDVDVFQLIFKYLVNLESLDIKRYEDYDFSPMHPLNYETSEFYDISRLTKLKRLKFYFPAAIIPGFSLEQVMQLKNLTSLSLCQSEPVLNNADQKRLMQSLPLLEELELFLWNGINPKIIISNGPRLNEHSKYKLYNNFR